MSTDERYERAPCGLLTIDRSGEILQANSTFHELVGGNVVGRSGGFLDLLRVGDRIFWETHVSPLLDMHGRVREIALELTTDSGPLPVLLNADSTATNSPATTIDLAVFPARDRRSYERDLLDARKRAEESEADARLLAETLQQSLIPPSLPSIQDLDAGAAFRPVGTGSEVGGDFYDFFRVNPSEWVVAMGDVCGKGPTAAAVTGLVRYTIRGAAMESDDLAEALHVANTTLLLDHTGETCTALLVRFRQVDVGHRALVVSAGHHLPRVVTPDGCVNHVGDHGPLLGVVSGASYTAKRTVLHRGSYLVMFTDGIVEARRGDDFFGEERLDRLLSEGVGASAQELADDVAAAAVDFQDGDPRDDIAIVVVRARAAAAR